MPVATPPGGRLQTNFGSSSSLAAVERELGLNLSSTSNTSPRKLESARLSQTLNMDRDSRFSVTHSSNPLDSARMSYMSGLDSSRHSQSSRLDSTRPSLAQTLRQDMRHDSLSRNDVVKRRDDPRHDALYRHDDPRYEALSRPDDAKYEALSRHEGAPRQDALSRHSRNTGHDANIRGDAVSRHNARNATYDANSRFDTGTRANVHFHTGTSAEESTVERTVSKPERHERGRQEKKRTSKKRKSLVSANISGTRYDIVRQVVERAGYIVTKDDDINSFLIWVDSFVSTDRIAEMKPYQRINHFPGMGEVCRKDCLARNMFKMAKAHPEEYNFVPKTWILPSEGTAFMTYARELKKKKKNKTFIVKPANGAMGNGIQLYRNPEKIPQSEHMIVQEYMDKPFLVDGYKCDMRIYVLVTSCDPLRVFLYNDGLLRLSTEKYLIPHDTNVDQLYMHLTNYSINKHNENYTKGESLNSGSKRSLKFFNDYLRKHDYDIGFMWKSITDIIVKTLIVAEPHLLHAYRMCRPGQVSGSDSVCFEVLGFDIIMDRKLKPWLLEINRSPSFGTDEQIDLQIKSGVLDDAFRLLNIRASDKKRNIAAQKAEAQRRLFRPNKRIDNDQSELNKKRQSVERKKEELKDLLMKVRRGAAREEYENRNSGRYQRIFPPDDKFKQEKYSTLLNDAFSIFLSGRSGSLQKEIATTYNQKLREVDILDMIAQCEADEMQGKAVVTAKPPRGPKPLSSMPTYEPEPRDNGDESMSVDSDDENFSLSRSQTNYEGRSRAQRGQMSRPSTQQSNRPSSEHRPAIRQKSQQRSKSLTRPGSSTRVPPTNVTIDDLYMNNAIRDREEDYTKKTLVALNDMRIKFPGKSDEEAEFVLDKLHESWKFHKPRVASYWLVKLDSIKRRKVIDIVRSNVRAVLQRVWRTTDVEALKLYRIFSRVFNRLLWSHGQGLWNCFSTSGSSWETIFSKSTDAISQYEMNCSRRIVQLCKDCLLIVYQFAADAKQQQANQENVDPRCKTGQTVWFYSLRI
ncbi:tubulin polyglutamylase TTLL7-like isoform X2 [Lineus longissimus]|uniref:tubulin polyglutamylase TTLL7-like isoform X2 n=1 Tax=Lineus longissimus TaxID=88925 RepID=UPI002B4EFCC9